MDITSKQNNAKVYNKSVPIKSNILIIQTDTPSVILREHPRFLIYQKVIVDYIITVPRAQAQSVIKS